MMEIRQMVFAKIGLYHINISRKDFDVFVLFFFIYVFIYLLAIFTSVSMERNKRCSEKIEYLFAEHLQHKCQ